MSAASPRLVQVVIASMVSPRERGRYAGYIGATFALATVSGPLIGGLIVDSPLGWRGTFFVGLPIALAAFVVLQAKLHLPVVRRPVQIDYLGATLIVGGVSILLVWVSLAGQQFGWTSPTSAAMVVVGLAVIAAALYVEAKVAVEPIIPLRLFKDRTTSLATAASVLIGVSMFGSTVYLSEYFQNARGMSPTEAGLMSVAMVGGLLVSSIVTGRIITATGLWKRYLVGGMVLVVVGLTLLGTIDATTPLVEVGAFMAVLGLGLGATMQNLVLAVQNNTAQADMGAASSVVSFFRSMGGSIGVSALGAVLSHQVTQKVTEGLAALGIEGGHSNGAIPDLAALPAPVRALYEGAFGEATGHLFLIAAPFALVALVCVLFIREVPLRTTLDHEEAAIGNNGPVRVERGQGRGGRPMTSRADSLRDLEREVGVMIRRIRRVIGDRARVGPRGPPARVVPHALLARRGGTRAGVVDGRPLRHRQGRGEPPAPAPRRSRPGRAHPGPRRRPGHPGRSNRRTPSDASRTSPRTAASGSTSSSATGARRSSRSSSPGWSATTSRSTT